MRRIGMLSLFITLIAFGAHASVFSDDSDVWDLNPNQLVEFARQSIEDGVPAQYMLKAASRIKKFKIGSMAAYEARYSKSFLARRGRFFLDAAYLDLQTQHMISWSDSDMFLKSVMFHEMFYAYYLGCAKPQNLEVVQQFEDRAAYLYPKLSRKNAIDVYKSIVGFYLESVLVRYSFVTKKMKSSTFEQREAFRKESRLKDFFLSAVYGTYDGFAGESIERVRRITDKDRAIVNRLVGMEITGVFENDFSERRLKMSGVIE